jgi:hypothetical protein
MSFLDGWNRGEASQDLVFGELVVQLATSGGHADDVLHSGALVGAPLAAAPGLALGVGQR